MAKYLKTAKLSMYKALGADPGVSFHPKLVPVSPTWSGLPRMILQVHRKVLVNQPASERALTVARYYATAWDIYKIVVCAPQDADLKSIVTPRPDTFAFYPWGGAPWNPIELCGSSKEDRLSHMPLITGLGDKFMWTAGPVPSKEPSSASWRAQATASLPFYARVSFDLFARTHISWPASGVFTRLSPHSELVGETVKYSPRLVPPRTVWERAQDARKAILQSLSQVLDIDLDLSDLRRFVPEAFQSSPSRGPSWAVLSPVAGYGRALALAQGPQAFVAWLLSVCMRSSPSGKVLGVRTPMMRLASTCWKSPGIHHS